MSRVHNKYADAFVTMASEVKVSDETVNVSIVKRTLQATTTNFLFLLIHLMRKIGKSPVFEV